MATLTTFVLFFLFLFRAEAWPEGLKTAYLRWAKTRVFKTDTRVPKLSFKKR